MNFFCLKSYVKKCGHMIFEDEFLAMFEAMRKIKFTITPNTNWV